MSVAQPIFITLFTFIDGLMLSIYGTIFNLMLRQSNIPTNVVGRIASFSLWGAAIFGLVFGLIADKFDKRKVVILSQFLSIFFGTYRIFSISVIELGLLSFFFGGFSSASNIILSTLLVLKTNREDRAKFFGLNFGVGMFTGVIGNIVGGSLGDILGIKPVLVFSSILRLLAIIPLRKITVGVAQVTEKHTEKQLVNSSFGRLNKFSKDSNVNNVNVDLDSGPALSLKNVRELFDLFSPKYSKVVFYYLLSVASVGFGAGLFVTFGNVIFYDLFHFNASSIGVILALAQFATSLGALFSHKLGKKFGDLNILVFSYVVVPILIVSLSFIRDPVVFTSVYVLRFAVMNMVSPLLSALVYSNIPKDKLATVNGISNFVNNLSRALSAELFALLTVFKSGYTLIFVISSIFYFANAYVMIRLYKHLS